MGLAAAKCMPKEKVIIVSGRTLSKLEKAVDELEQEGFTAYACTCDTSDRDEVRQLAAFATAKGQVTNVIHAAGLSPNMAEPEQLLWVNALGTVYVNQEFSKIMPEGSVIVDISSNSAYVLPAILKNKRLYNLAEKDEESFVRKSVRLSHLPRDPYKQSGFAYAISKYFVVWYAQKCAFEYGKKGIRVCSLSPGLVATDMGRLEEKEGGELLKFAAEGRMGTPEELGFAIASAADERNGYLAGVDILVDGGSTNGKGFRQAA